MTYQEISSKILKTLGSGNFINMTGATNFTVIQDGLQFDLPNPCKNDINQIQVILETSGTYTMRALKTHDLDRHEIRTESGLPREVLQMTFEYMTGMVASL